MDSGLTVASDPEAQAILRQLGERLGIAERTVKPRGAKSDVPKPSEATLAAMMQQTGKFLTSASSAAGVEPVPLVGPVEAKVIRGSDGRLYVMDWVRSTPRDPAYYDGIIAQAKAAFAERSAKGEAAEDETEEGAVATALHASCYEAVLRPELLRLYAKYVAMSAAQEYVASPEVKAKMEAARAASLAAAKAGDTAALASADAEIEALMSGFVPPAPVQYNLNSFTRYAPQCAASPEEAAADEEAIRKASAYLQDMVLPALLRDMTPMARGQALGFGDGTTPGIVPIDGEGLTRMLHSRGVNMRYLGRLASLAATTHVAVAMPEGDKEKTGAVAEAGMTLATAYPYIIELLETEMVARVVRRKLDALLRGTTNSSGSDVDIKPAAAPGVAVAGFLSALLTIPAAASAAGAADASEAGSSEAPGGGPSSASGSGGKKEKAVGKKGGKKGEDGAVATPVTSAAPPPLHSTVTLPFPSPTGLLAGAVEPLDDEDGAPSNTTGEVVIVPVPRVSYPANDIPTATAVTTKALEDAGLASSSSAAAASAALWAEIRAGVRAKFGYELTLWPGHTSAAPASTTGDAASASPASSEAGHKVNRYALLRRIATRSGLQLAPRALDFTSSQPLTSDDVLGFAPVVTSTLGTGPSGMPEAAALTDATKEALSRNDVQRAYACAMEALQQLVNVCGYHHASVAHASQTLALVLASAGDLPAAIQHQQRAVTLFQRVLGPDAGDTALSHLYLGQYYQAIGAMDAAVRHVSRAVYLQQLVAPARHPDVIGGYFRLGSLLTDCWHVTGAARAFNEALTRATAAASDASGSSGSGAVTSDLGTVMSVLHAQAMNACLIGAFKEAIAHEKRVFALCAERLPGGKDSPQARLSSLWITEFTKKAVEIEKLAKEQEQARQTQAKQAAAAAAAAEEQAAAQAAFAAATSGFSSGSGGGGKGGSKKRKGGK